MLKKALSNGDIFNFNDLQGPLTLNFTAFLKWNISKTICIVRTMLLRTLIGNHTYQMEW